MYADEALKILGLEQDATPEEIKQAYRDLVKVWHPDRFGSDVRLRAKAEDRLKQINMAYSSLEAGGSQAAPIPPSPPTQQPQPGPIGRHSQRQTAPAERVLRFGLYAASALLIAGMAGSIVHQLAFTSRETPSPVGVSSPTPSPTSVLPRPKHERQAASDASRSSSPAFQVWSLSPADTDQMQLACSGHPAGSEAYRNCLAAQLQALRGSPSPPQLSGMNTGERRAAESACADAKGSGGDPAYRRCLKRQVAALAAETIRPDLTGLSQTDQDSIQAACSGAREGGAADYDRCLVRFAKTIQSAEEKAR